MTYKLITEDEVQQAITMLDTGIPVASRRVAAILRAVMEREGPKQSAWLVSHEKYAEAFVRKTDADAFANSSDAQSVLGATDEWTKQPLYTLPDEDKR